MIVPIWGNSNPQYQSLREIIINNGKNIYLSHFAVRPSKIFVNAEMNLTIITLIKNNKRSKFIKSTKYIRWHNNERKNLFNTLSFVEIDIEKIIDHLEYMVFPKISSSFEITILKKLLNIRDRIEKYISKNENDKIDIFIHSGGRYWRKAFDELYIKQIDLKINSNWKKISIKRKYAYPIACLFNSSFFYWFWIVFSDCYNVRRNLLDSFPIGFNNCQMNVLNDLYWKLVDDYKRNVSINENYKYDNKYIFNISKSKEIINEIDMVLGEHYGFNKQEIDYIINYDIDFRMGKGSQNIH